MPLATDSHGLQKMQLPILTAHALLSITVQRAGTASDTKLYANCGRQFFHGDAIPLLQIHRDVFSVHGQVVLSLPSGSTSARAYCAN